MSHPHPRLFLFYCQVPPTSLTNKGVSPWKFSSLFYSLSWLPCLEFLSLQTHTLPLHSHVYPACLTHLLYNWERVWTPIIMILSMIYAHGIKTLNH